MKGAMIALYLFHILQGGIGDVLSLSIGSGFDFIEYQAVGDRNRKIPNAAGGGRAAGRADPGSCGAEYSVRDCVPFPAERTGRHRDFVHRRNGHRPA